MFIFVGPGCVEEAVEEGRQTVSCQSAFEEPANPEGLLALYECVFMYVLVCERERQKWQQYSYANMSYGLTYTDTKHLIAKKKSLSGSIVSNVFNVNLTLWGHLLLC